MPGCWQRWNLSRCERLVVKAAKAATEEPAAPVVAAQVVSRLVLLGRARRRWTQRHRS